METKITLGKHAEPFLRRALAHLLRQATVDEDAGYTDAVVARSARLAAFSLRERASEIADDFCDETGIRIALDDPAMQALIQQV